MISISNFFYPAQKDSNFKDIIEQQIIKNNRSYIKNACCMGFIIYQN